MAKCKIVRLKHQEIHFLLQLAKESRDSGDKRYKRNKIVITKLKQALSTRLETSRGGNNDVRSAGHNR